MIHFFLTFSDDASDSPFAHALRDLKVDHRIISAKVLLRYRRRIWLILVGLPRLMFVALRAAWQSLVTMRPVPDAVVVNSHFEVLGAARHPHFVSRIHLHEKVQCNAGPPAQEVLRVRVSRH